MESLETEFLRVAKVGKGDADKTEREDMDKCVTPALRAFVDTVEAEGICNVDGSANTIWPDFTRYLGWLHLSDSEYTPENIVEKVVERNANPFFALTEAQHYQKGDWTGLTADAKTIVFRTTIKRENESEWLLRARKAFVQTVKDSDERKARLAREPPRGPRPVVPQGEPGPEPAGPPINDERHDDFWSCGRKTLIIALLSAAAVAAILCFICCTCRSEEEQDQEQDLEEGSDASSDGSNKKGPGDKAGAPADV